MQPNTYCVIKRPARMKCDKTILNRLVLLAGRPVRKASFVLRERADALSRSTVLVLRRGRPVRKASFVLRERADALSRSTVLVLRGGRLEHKESCSSGDGRMPCPSGFWSSGEGLCPRVRAGKFCPYHMWEGWGYPWLRGTSWCFQDQSWGGVFMEEA